MAAKQKNGKDANKSQTETINELNEPCWSVVTFETRAAKNLTYEQAAEKLRELAEQRVSGLCIITDEAAERISKK